MTALAINPPLRTVRLYGALGSKFGRVHRFALDTNSPAEAVRALCSQLRGFEAWLMGAKKRGLGFAVFAGKRNLGKEDLQSPVGNEDIRIAPIILGNKQGGIFQIILGIILIVVSIYDGGLTAPEAAALFAEGAGLVIGGVVQLLAPHSKGSGSKDSPANTPSYSFNGPINTEAQGHPVPLLYGGPLKVGSAVISAGIDVTDHSSAYAPYAASSSGGMGGGGDLNRGRIEQR